MVEIARKYQFWIGLVIVLGITAAVYYPSLSHILKGETYCYFLDTTGDYSPKELITNWWNYESVRQIAPGDRLLFRPLLFVTLGLEKAYFGGDYLSWRITALIIHLFTTFCLYRLLWRFRKGILAILLAVFFGTSYLCLNTMLYEQIAAYSLFTGLLLCAVYYLYQGTERNSHGDMVIATLFMLFACFLHETGIIFTALFIGYVWCRRRELSTWKWWAGSFAAILVIWAAIYFPSKFINPARFLDTELANIASWQTMLVGIKGSFVLFTRWGQQALVPALTVINPMTEWWSYPVDIQYYYTYEYIYGAVYSVPSYLTVYLSLAVNAVALLACGWVYLDTESKDHKVRNSFLALILLAMGAFIVANSIFRTNSHGGNYLVGHNFNLYIWSALLVFFIYMLISMQKLGRKHIAVLAAVIVIFIGFNAPQVVSVNQDIKEMQTETREYFALIDDFLDENEGTIKIIPTTEMQDALELTYWKVPEDIESNFPTPDNLYLYDEVDSSIPEIIYERRWDNDNPDYILEYHPHNSSLEVINE